MPFTDSGLDDFLNGTAPSTFISFHTADPGTTGANEVAGTRPATTWAAVSAHPTSGRRRVGSQVSQSIPGGTTVTHWGVNSTATGGVFKYGGALDASETFGSAGTINHTPTLRLTNGA